MSKELDTNELSLAIVEMTTDDITKLDDLSLAIIGGGQASVFL